MNEKVLRYLKSQGFDYLVKESGKLAFIPYKGNIQDAINKLSSVPLCEDWIISVDEAIQMAHLDGLREEKILLMK